MTRRGLVGDTSLLIVGTLIWLMSLVFPRLEQEEGT